MILDYNYNSYSRRLDLSYIEDSGAKQLVSFNVNRFKAYYSTPNGKFTNWAGDKCDVRWVEKPSKFEIKTFLTELDPKYKQLLTKRTFPKVYTFDIEALADENGDYSEPEYARCPISTISICSPDLNTLVLGTLPFNDWEKQTLEKNFTEYMQNTQFFHELNMKMPYVKYVYFASEELMLKYFLSNIVAKVPILTGWNCIKYDWNYIVNRIKNYYPHLSVKLGSCNSRVSNKNYKDRFGNKMILPMPDHTLILDMMEIIEQEDKKVLPMKESMKLDYIASASMGIHKIEYTRSLDDLYREDYGRYVFYNSIDSVLVQLINYRFKTMDHIYLYALYCNEKIASCFSKIALTEALVFKDFYEQGLKIVYEDKPEPARSALIGAYVKKPIPGIHQFVCCNDFASLYPSTIRTCNLSFENYICACWDNVKLEPYRLDRKQYIVIGPNVFKNDGTADKPVMGSSVGVFLDEAKLAKYRADTQKYFVSVNGCVYKNDKDYSFRRIQARLKAARDHDKYLGKRIEATVMFDIEKKLAGHQTEFKTYEADIVEDLRNIGIDYITCTQDIFNMSEQELNSIKGIIRNEIVYLDSNQLAMKYLMNSMYGGASHVNFYWYNMNIANDITGEARNLIHRMEHHIPDFVKKNWTTLYDVHKQLGIEVDQELAKKILDEVYYVPKEVDPDTYNEPSFVIPVYGDTDSLYISYENLLKTIKGIDKMTVEQKRDIIVQFNTGFLDEHNRQFIADYYDTRGGKSVHNFELETLNKAGVWLNVKKRYAQLLLWKDGYKFELDHLKMKVTGLEMNKAAAPGFSREILSGMVRFMLENSNDKYLINKLNIELQKYQDQWNEKNIDDICPNIKVNGYRKYIIDDTGQSLKTMPKCPSNVRGLGNYNRIRNYYHLPGDAIYGGKLKQYEYRSGTDWDYFSYEAMNYPNWGPVYAPIDRTHMFQKYVLDPLNRILVPSGLPELNTDHSIQMSLF
jgi:DNA polymerase elongation subunit (family B)